MIAPPYDVIDDRQREELEARSPYNAVRVDLPRGNGDQYEDAIAHATPRSAEAKGDVLCHGEMWEEGIVLGHVAYTPLLRWQMATLGAVVERLAVEEDAPRVWLHNASNSL